MKGNLNWIALAIAALAICAGCGGVAQDSFNPRIVTLHDGATSYAQVIAAMGKPYQDWGEPDGGRTVVYMLNHPQIGADTRTPQAASPAPTKVTLKFDPNGMLTSHSPQSGRELPEH